MNTAHAMPFVIDTLQFAKRMQKAGLKQEIAEEMAEILKESQVQSLDSLATKQDLKNLEIATKQDIKNLEMATKQDIKNLEHKLTIKLFFMLSAAVGAITWLDKVIN